MEVYNIVKEIMKVKNHPFALMRHPRFQEEFIDVATHLITVLQESGVVDEDEVQVLTGLIGDSYFSYSSTGDFARYLKKILKRVESQGYYTEYESEYASNDLDDYEIDDDEDDDEDEDESDEDEDEDDDY